MTRRATEEETLVRWQDLKNAIQVVECALPSQMSAAIEHLIYEKKRFDDLMHGRNRLSEEDGKFRTKL